MIISYVLDCGCEFKHKPQAHMVTCYEITKTCFAHSLSSGGPPDVVLPPDPMPFPNVMLQRQALSEPVHTVCEHLEHTQPIVAPMPVTRFEFEALKAIVNSLVPNPER